MDSWRPNTHKSYNTYIQKWREFVDKNKISSPTYVHVANFLTELYAAGASYSTVNLARSAVSAYLCPDDVDKIGQHPLVCKIVKGVFNNRPSLPKYCDTWEVDTVIDMLGKWPDAEQLSLMKLTLRTLMLIALLSGQRGQTLHSLTVDDVKMYKSKCVLVYSSLLKQSKPGTHLKPLEIPCFENKRLCAVHHLHLYLKKTSSLRTGKALFISCIKPYAPVKRDTISRWIKEVLTMAGIDVTKYSAHSTRAASTSAALSRGAQINTVLQAGGWSNKSTFTRFYHKIAGQSEDDSVGSGKTKGFAQSVMDKFVNKGK